MKKKIWFTKKLRWMSAVLSVVMILLLLPSVSATADNGRSVEQMAEEIDTYMIYFTKFPIN